MTVMGKVAVSFLLCFLWSIPIAAQTTTDRERAELRGPVKGIDVYQVDYFLKDGRTVAGKPRHLDSTAYNVEGNMVERISYDRTGKITGKYKYNYDEKGRNTGGEDCSATPEGGSSTSKDIYVLDNKGRKTEHSHYDSDGSVSTRFVYKYDAKGNLNEEEWYAHTGQLGERSIYTYDEVGHQTSRTLYDGNGSYSWKTLSNYDAKGNQTEWVQYQGDKLRYKVVSKYDEKGRILEKETFEYNGVPGAYASHAPVPGKIIYSYDDEKKMMEEAAFNPEGEMKEKFTYVYDKRGSEVERRTFSGDGSPKDLELQFYDDIYKPGSQFRGMLRGTALTEVEYDSHGNWIKRTRLIQAGEGCKAQPYSAEQRSITYY